MHLDDRVRKARREAAELSGADRNAFTLDLKHQTAGEDHKARVALKVSVRPRVYPAFVTVVQPDLEPPRLETHLVRRFST